MSLYPGYWNGVSGFLDDQRSLKEKVEDEIREELSIPKSKIRRIRLGEIFDQEDLRHKKTWVVHPVLVEVITDKAVLDWEAEEYRWVAVREAKKLPLLPGFQEVLKRVSLWLRK